MGGRTQSYHLFNKLKIENMPKVYISKITLPVGNETVTYNFRDEYAQQKLAGGLQFVICWDGEAPVVANIPAGVVVKYQGENYTGTKAASTAEPLTFYLVKSSTQVDGKDVYEEYVASGSPKAWEKIGDTQYDFSRLKALAFEDEVVLEKGSGDNVLGASTVLGMAAASDVTLKSSASHTTDSALGSGTTFTMSPSTVTVTGSETSKVLGANTTFKAASSEVSFSDDPTTGAALGANATFTTSVASSNKYLAATATDMAISSDGNDAQVLTGIGAGTTGTFYTKADEMKKKLITTDVYGTDGSEDVSAVSNIATNYMELASVPHASSVGAADTWAFSHDSSTNTLTISGANGTTPIVLAASDDTVATGAMQASSTGAGDAIITGMTISEVSAAKKAANATTVATGALLASGAEGYSEETGAEVVYGVDTDTDSAITALGTQAKTAILTGVSVTDPSISLALENSDAAGRVSVGEQISAANISTVVNNADTVNAITGLASATAAGQVITTNVKEEIDAFTVVGTVTAPGQEITVGTNDLVDVITDLGQMEAAAQTVEVKTADVVKVAKYGDLDVDIN